MITTLTAAGPEDLLAAVPLVLGFAPEHSLVMLTFSGTHRFHARVDLPADPDSAAERRAVVTAMLAPARRHGVTRVAFVLYTADRRMSRRLGGALRKACREEGIDVIDLLRVAHGRWYPAVDSSSRPSRGKAYDPSRHPFLTEAVVAGQVTAGSRAEFAARLAADEQRVVRVEQLVAGARTLTPDEVEELVTRHLAGRCAPSDQEAADLLVSVKDRERRDRGWMDYGREEAPALIEFWTDIVRRAPPALVADPAAVLAFAAWLGGNGALAWCALDRCFAVEPWHPLGLLLARALELAVPPSVWDGEAAS